MSHPQRRPNAIDSDRRGVSEEDKAAWWQVPVASACKLSNARPFLLQLLQLIAKSQLTSLSGVAQKNYFNILDKIVRKGKLVTDVSDNQCSVRRWGFSSFLRPRNAVVLGRAVPTGG